MQAGGDRPHAYRIVVQSTRLERPIAWDRKRTQVVLDEEILILPGVNIAQRFFGAHNAALERVEVGQLDSLRVAEDLGEAQRESA